MFSIVFCCFIHSRFDHGFAYGHLLALEIRANYEALLHALLGDKWYSDVLIDAVADVCAWQVGFLFYMLRVLHDLSVCFVLFFVWFLFNVALM